MAQEMHDAQSSSCCIEIIEILEILLISAFCFLSFSFVFISLFSRLALDWSLSRLASAGEQASDEAKGNPHGIHRSILVVLMPPCCFALVAWACEPPLQVLNALNVEDLLELVCQMS